MPNLTIVQLPSNHTRGTSPGTSTPQAMVADNDLALGRIVEVLSKSPFWKRMAIFVVEAAHRRSLVSPRPDGCISEDHEPIRAPCILEPTGQPHPVVGQLREVSGGRLAGL